MNISQRLTELSIRIGTEFKTIRTSIAASFSGVDTKMGDLANLETTAKTNLVAAINEAFTSGTGGGVEIDDDVIALDTVWSSSKTAGQIGTLSALSTTAKSNLVVAVNEVVTSLGGKATPADITAAISALVGGAGSSLDTLKELADALGSDPNFATTVTNALAKRVRVDAAQAFSDAEQTQACANIGVGDPGRDFVGDFEAALV